MTIEQAGLFWLAVGGYLAAGLVFGIIFLWIGAAKIDHAARGSTFLFKVTTLPGVMALWPFVLVRWLSGRVINTPVHDDAAPSEDAS